MRTNFVFTIAFLFISYTLSSQTVTGVRMINLSEYNLAKLGIRVSDEGVFYIDNTIIKRNGNITNKPRKILLTKNLIKVISSSKNGKDEIQSFSPYFAVNIFKNGSAVFYNQSKDLKYLFDSTGSINTSQQDSNGDWINQLVCIHVEFSPKSRTKQNVEMNHAYFWFKANTDFLEALPLNIAEPIWSEMLTPKQAIEDSPKGRFTDTWRGTNELLSTKPLFPNPANETTTLEFTLSITAILSISLYDFTGQKIKDFSINQQYQSGKNTIILPLDTLSEGMYLIAINPTGSESAVQRLIIAK